MTDAARIALMMQLRRQGVTDTATLSAIESVPRDRFVDTAYAESAWDNNALPIACNQTISQPSVVAIMTQALDVNDRHMVLEIGTGSGYQAAILAKLARRVHTVECHEDLFNTACARFEALGLRNITPHLGNGREGWKHAAPYDRIMITAAAQEIPDALLNQLRPDGALIAPIGDPSGEQVLTTLHREGDTWVKKSLAPVQFVPLTG